MQNTTVLRYEEKLFHLTIIFCEQQNYKRTTHQKRHEKGRGKGKGKGNGKGQKQKEREREREREKDREKGKGKGKVHPALLENHN